jgi:hypothetical protein
MTLDESEKQAHDMLDFLRRDYERQAAPYIKILCDIQAIRPRVFYVPDDNGKLLEMIPLMKAAQ